MGESAGYILGQLAVRVAAPFYAINAIYIRKAPEVFKEQTSSAVFAGWRTILYSALPNPASLARTMAWARSATCNLVRMLET